MNTQPDQVQEQEEVQKVGGDSNDDGNQLRNWMFIALLAVTLLAALTATWALLTRQTTKTVEVPVTVQVEKRVVETVVIEKEKIVERPVVETVIVEKEVVVVNTPVPSSSSGGSVTYPAGNQPTGYCQVNGQTDQQALNWEPSQKRLWMADHLVQQLKAAGGSCWVQFSGATTFTLNSVEGTIVADGYSVANGNGLLITCSRLEVTYGGTIADGFDLWVKSTTAAAPKPPAPAPSTAGAWGSCTWSGTQYNLSWESDKRRLWMPWFDEAKAANATQAIPCHLHAAVAGTLEALGKNEHMNAGSDWLYTFPANDASFGFAFQGN